MVEPKAESGYSTARIQNLRTSQGYMFFILQHLATNLCSITHSKTFFLAVVLDFVLRALIKILSIQLESPVRKV
jgi:hypothetical protein